MATVITGGDLKLVADKAIANSSETLLATKSFSLGVSTDGMTKGDSTQVFVAGAVPEAKEFNATDNNYMTDNGGEHAWKSVRLDYHTKQTFKVSPFQFEKLNSDSLAALYKPHVISVASKIVSNVFSKITAAAFPTSLNIGAMENFDKSEVGKTETALAKLIGSSTERNMVLNFDYFDALRDSLTGIYANPTNNEVLRNGMIPGINGFAKIIRTTALKAAVATGDMVGIATNMTGVALAIATVKQVPQFDGDVEVATEEITGIPLTFSVDYDKETRSYVATVEALYGIDVMDKKGILRLTAAVGA